MHTRTWVLRLLTHIHAYTHIILTFACPSRWVSVKRSSLSRFSGLFWHVSSNSCLWNVHVFVHVHIHINKIHTSCTSNVSTLLAHEFKPNFRMHTHLNTHPYTHTSQDSNISCICAVATQTFLMLMMPTFSICRSKLNLLRMIVFFYICSSHANILCTDGVVLHIQKQSKPSLYWWCFFSEGIGGKPTVKRVAVVCPTSLVKNWAAEIVKWLGDRLDGVYACVVLVCVLYFGVQAANICTNSFFF
jgi:hypothetical protein